MTTATAVLLGLTLYVLLALPVAVVIGRMLGGAAPAGVAGAAGALAREGRPADVAAAARTEGAQLPVRPVAPAYVALGRGVALVAGRPHAGRDLQLAGTEAHPAHS